MHFMVFLCFPEDICALHLGNEWWLLNL